MNTCQVTGARHRWRPFHPSHVETPKWNVIATLGFVFFRVYCRECGECYRAYLDASKRHIRINRLATRT